MCLNFSSCLWTCFSLLYPSSLFCCSQLFCFYSCPSPLFMFFHSPFYLSSCHLSSFFLLYHQLLSCLLVVPSLISSIHVSCPLPIHSFFTYCTTYSLYPCLLSLPLLLSPLSCPVYPLSLFHVLLSFRSFSS